MAATVEELVRRVRMRRSLPLPADRRALRLAAGVSLEDVAEVVGVTRQAVRLWELEGRLPRAGHLERYLAVLDALRAEVASLEGV